MFDFNGLEKMAIQIAQIDKIMKPPVIINIMNQIKKNDGTIEKIFKKAKIGKTNENACDCDYPSYGCWMDHMDHKTKFEIKFNIKGNNTELDNKEENVSFDVVSPYGTKKYIMTFKKDYVTNVFQFFEMFKKSDNILLLDIKLDNETQTYTNFSIFNVTQNIGIQYSNGEWKVFTININFTDMTTKDINKLRKRKNEITKNMDRNINNNININNNNLDEDDSEYDSDLMGNESCTYKYNEDEVVISGIYGNVSTDKYDAVGNMTYTKLIELYYLASGDCEWHNCRKDVSVYLSSYGNLQGPFKKMENIFERIARRMLRIKNDKERMIRGESYFSDSDCEDYSESEIDVYSFRKTKNSKGKNTYIFKKNDKSKNKYDDKYNDDSDDGY